MKSNIDKLRDAIRNGNAMADILYCVTQVEEDMDELRDQIADSEFTTINLGLDSINYYFDKGNLLITEQFKAWCLAVQNQNVVSAVQNHF